MAVVLAEVEHADHPAVPMPHQRATVSDSCLVAPLRRKEHDPHLRGAAGVGVERVDRAERAASAGSTGLVR